MHRLFVYGTLRSGEANHAWLRGAHRIGAAITAARYELLDLGAYPALIAGGTTAIAGELYSVDDATLGRIDAFEGHPDELSRGEVTLEAAEPAWAYFLARERAAGARRIASGDWRRRHP
jgi:gamma-glutamylcyclotransferase (GGCT)/AIG2-like uncharacterized protein YtfP